MTDLNRKSKIIIPSLVVLGTFVLAMILVLGILQFVNSGRIIHGLSLNNQKIGGLSFGAAKGLVEKKYKDLAQKEVVLVLGEKKWEFLAQDFGFSFDLDATLEQITALGHKPNIFSSISEQIKALLSNQDFLPQTNFDSEQFNLTLERLETIERPPQNASLTYNQKKDTFTVLAEKNGQVLDRQNLKTQILAALINQTSSEIELNLIEETPQVSAQDIRLIKFEAQDLIEQAAYSLKNDGLSWPIEKQDLASWISVDPDSKAMTLDKNKIIDYLSQVALLINQKPINAKLKMEKGKIGILASSQEGKSLDIEASSQKIIQDILNGQKNIELVVDAIEPEITEQNIKGLGITALLGEGESSFAGSPQNRKFNLSLGASKLNGWLIKPGEEFSFNQTLGEVDEKNGYLPELVIKNKQTIPDFGGGICQVSTTLFRAAVNSGLKIVERHPHAYPVRYYLPTGFDATVYSPSPDLKFLNDTPNYILLQNKIEGTKLIFEIYGTADGRETKVKGPFVTESNPDGSMKTILTQEIWRDGQLEQQNVFRSSYKSASLYPHATSTPETTATSPSPSPSPAPNTSILPSPIN